MLHIFERMQHRLQKVVAYMEEWCSLCKVILQVIFACLFTIIIHREHIAQIGACLKCTFFKCYLSFKQCHTFLQRVVTLRNGILYAKSF